MLIFLIFSNFSINVSSLSSISNDTNEKIIDRIIKDIEIAPGCDYVISYSSESNSLNGELETPYSDGLSEKTKNAIAKSPIWLRRDLTRQFLAIDSEAYADLILESSKKYTDEIAFSIAFSVIGRVPPVDIIQNNVMVLYENDKWIKYADIIDYDNNYGNYYSTVRYRVIENDLIKEIEFPSEIYYWYIVHPSLTGENPLFIYDSFWRDYLVNHNDLGYPLLKEKLSEIDYLWDCQSYFQPKDRTWNWSMSNHPTAIEAISYWIGKTVPEWAFGDRPSQPNLIAHQHNGWCGELQKIAVAAQRAVLIPSVAVSNRGEDHVWREFYERGWHENDNWWADGGGAVDKPDIYAYGWNKDMSAIHSTRGDSVIDDVTATYIHTNERKTFTFKVVDRSLSPVDGARVTAAVTGPNDITWLRNELTIILEKIWDFLPDILKGRILQTLYNKVKQRIDEIPDTIDAPIYSIWNFTDVDGYCTFELGQNRSYTFIIQYGNLKKPLIPARFNKFRSIEDPVDKDYTIWFPLLSPVKLNHKNLNMPNGEIHFEISFDTNCYQLQNSILGNQNKGLYDGKGKIDFFVVDQENYIKYLDGKKFDCYNFISDDSRELSIKTPNSDWYLIFRNSCRESNMILNISVSVQTSTSESKVTICTPYTSIFDNPIVNIGDKIKISGVATDDIILNLNDELLDIDVLNYEWEYLWDTNGFEPSDYPIFARCNDVQDQLIIKLDDSFPPDLCIKSPENYEIIESNHIVISGKSSDNYGIEKVEIKIDNSKYHNAVGTENWSIEWDLDNLDIGNHKIYARCIDKYGRISFDEKTFVLNESGHIWGPKINNFYHKPNHPTNLSNIIVFANVTEDSPFGIKNVTLGLNDGITTYSKSMFRYADNPIQGRHAEDILKNDPNEPIFGLELGQFNTGTMVNYWIEAYDYANNVILSNISSFNVI